MLLKVKSGQNMTVLSKEGRWLKVRVQGRTGYVRSKVDMPDGDEIVEGTRRRPFVDGRSTKRGFGGDEGPDDCVGADATGDVASSAGDDDDSSSGDDDGGKKTHAKKPKGDDDDSGDDDGGKKHALKKPKGDDSDDSDDSGDSKASSDDGDDAEPDDSKTEEPEEDDCPCAHVGKKTKILADRDKDSDTQFVAKPDEVLDMTDKKGKWKCSLSE